MKREKKSLLFHFGNACIALAVFGLLYTFFPLLSLYFFPHNIVLPQGTATSITIPKIQAVAPIIENVNPWDEQTYQKALQKGVAHASHSSNPEKSGTIYLFAHSSGMPWELTRYNTVFLRLGELQSGDVISLSWHGKRYRYAVYDKKTVNPQNVEYLMSKNESELILQTCTPIGTDLKRLLIFAKKI